MQYIIRLFITALAILAITSGISAQSADTVIFIADFEDLLKIGMDSDYPLSGSYRLTADIDASPSRGFDNGFTPIGRLHMILDAPDTAVAFTGSFNGGGFTIRGLYINRPEQNIAHSAVGLFGYTYNADIKNVAVIADSVIGYRYVGILAGLSSGGTMSGCYTSGIVIGMVEVGGIVGKIENGATMSKSYTSSSIRGRDRIGGLVGENNLGSISSSYSYGTVSANDGGNCAGGLVGLNYGQVENSYSAVSVSGADKVGGIAGENIIGGNIVRNYAIGAVTATGAAGGLFGNNGGAAAYNRWDTLRTGQSTAGTSATSIAGNTGHTTMQMADGATFNWVFIGDSAVWGIANNYPYLRGLPTYTMTFRTTLGGTVSGADTDGVHVQIVNPGINGMNVTADRSEVGEEFEGWYLIAGGTDSSAIDELLVSEDYGTFFVNLMPPNDRNISLSGISGNVEIEARFTLKKFEVTYIGRAGGKVKLEAGDDNTALDTLILSVEYGALGPRVAAVPDIGFNFARWTDYTMNNPAANATDIVRADTVFENTSFNAHFIRDTVSLTYSVDDGGERIGVLLISPPARRVEKDTTINIPFGNHGPQVEAMVDPIIGTRGEDYRFVEWSDGVTDNVRRDSSVAYPINVRAIFAPITFDVTYIAGEGGKVVLNSGALGDDDADEPIVIGVDTLIIPVNRSKNGPEVTAVPDSGFVFVMWSDNVEAAARSDTLVRGNITVTAIFRSAIAVLEVDRTVSGIDVEVIAVVSRTETAFTVGPNPAPKAGGKVVFFRQGKALADGTLFVYDASGNLVAKVAVADDGIDSARREIGSWNFGSSIAEGTYVVRGVLTAKDGSKARVSYIIGIR